jgi:hypothetical protein
MRGLYKVLTKDGWLLALPYEGRAFNPDEPPQPSITS